MHQEGLRLSIADQTMLQVEPNAVEAKVSDMMHVSGNVEAERSHPRRLVGT